MSCGPGITLVWPEGRLLKASHRQDGRFGLSINGQEKLAGMCDLQLPVTIAFLLEKDAIRVIASGEGVYQQDQELARIPRADFPGAPTMLRLGKVPDNGKSEDAKEAGLIGWSRCDWVRVYGE